MLYIRLLNIKFVKHKDIGNGMLNMQHSTVITKSSKILGFFSFFVIQYVS